MENKIIQTPCTRLQDYWPEFQQEIIAYANKVLEGVEHIYKTDTQNLPEIYLAHLSEDRQHYNCNACRMFLSKYGGLVVIKNNEIISVFWDKEGSAFPYFSESVKQMNRTVKNAKITHVFTFNENGVMDEKVLGIPKSKAHSTGFTWTHFHFPVPPSFRKDLLPSSTYQ